MCVVFCLTLGLGKKILEKKGQKFLGEKLQENKTREKSPNLQGVFAASCNEKSS
jgi:hypothetical protein